MTNYDLSEEARKKLMGVATPTIATALFKRGLRNQFIQDVRPLSAKQSQYGRASLYAALHTGPRRP